MEALKVKAEETVADVFTEIATAIEGLSATDAIASLKTLIEQEGLTDFRLGGVLATIQGNKYWSSAGFSSFKEFVQLEFGMEYRKGMYLITIYTSLVESAVKYEDVKDIGWSKLKEIANLLTKENAAQLVDKARELTLIQLQEYLRQLKAGMLQSSGADMTEKSSLTSISFKVHKDQKETIKQAVEKAKIEAETEFDSVALESICLNYLTGGAVKPVSLAELMKKLGVSDVINTIDTIWPHLNFQMTAAEPVSNEGFAKIDIETGEIHEVL